ncbi:MAG: NADH-quinone oxidoreductase subunit NuoN [Gammaproteobacteria bacterium CG22_combo_CG10-13_8_21_14_all_40_8]|nr:MAG: NADH-quinone oxidoreductase subunit NuoN [Gammaproteobacteria bacterium CG22_combo_CG10-13_8_21_14_all_40_8]
MYLTPDLSPLAAEFFVLIMACVVMVADLYFADDEHKLTYWLTQLTLGVAAFITAGHLATEPQVLYQGTFVVDYMAGILKIAIYIATMISLLYARDYIAVRHFLKGEYYMLTLFSVLGMMVLVSAHSLLTVYLGLELLSLPLYAMVAMERNNGNASEAAMKYFVMGAIASGFLLYGMSLIYGATSTLELTAILNSLGHLGQNQLMVNFGLMFIVAGLAFKIGAVPFHMWVPDVYHGAPTAVTLFVGSAPKIAAFGMMIRLLVDGLAPLLHQWQSLLIIMSILSMAVGNIVAIAQLNLKRMLAYSTIGHVGYFLLGILSGNNEGYAASMYYILIYALMTLASFGMIVFLSRAGFESDKISDFKGLAKRSPWYAAMTMFTMLSLAGVPPFVGFWPKLEVIKAAVHGGFVSLAVFAVVMSLIGAFYYLRIVKTMYFEELDEPAKPIVVASDVRLMMIANGMAMLVLGIFPGWILQYCLTAFGL